MSALPVLNCHTLACLNAGEFIALKTISRPCSLHCGLRSMIYVILGAGVWSCNVGWSQCRSYWKQGISSVEQVTTLFCLAIVHYLTLTERWNKLPQNRLGSTNLPCPTPYLLRERRYSFRHPHQNLVTYSGRNWMNCALQWEWVGEEGVPLKAKRVYVSTYNHLY